MWLDSFVYGPDIDFRIRLGLPIVTLFTIWIAETVLSTLSLITIAKLKLAKKTFTSVRQILQMFLHISEFRRRRTTSRK